MGRILRLGPCELHAFFEYHKNKKDNSFGIRHDYINMASSVPHVCKVCYAYSYRSAQYLKKRYSALEGVEALFV